MILNEFKYPPELELIHVSLRESNGEHGIYECMYTGQDRFLFLDNRKEYWLTNKHNELLIGRKDALNTEVYLIGKPFISWWIPKKKKEDQNDSTSTVL